MENHCINAVAIAKKPYKESDKKDYFSQILNYILLNKDTVDNSEDLGLFETVYPAPYNNNENLRDRNKYHWGTSYSIGRKDIKVVSVTADTMILIFNTYEEPPIAFYEAMEKHGNVYIASTYINKTSNFSGKFTQGKDTRQEKLA